MLIDHHSGVKKGQPYILNRVRFVFYFNIGGVQCKFKFEFSGLRVVSFTSSKPHFHQLHVIKPRKLWIL